MTYFRKKNVDKYKCILLHSYSSEMVNAQICLHYFGLIFLAGFVYFFCLFLRIFTFSVLVLRLSLSYLVSENSIIAIIDFNFKI